MNPTESATNTKRIAEKLTVLRIDSGNICVQYETTATASETTTKAMNAVTQRCLR